MPMPMPMPMYYYPYQPQQQSRPTSPPPYFDAAVEAYVKKQQQ